MTNVVLGRRLGCGLKLQGGRAIENTSTFLRRRAVDDIDPKKINVKKMIEALPLIAIVRTKEGPVVLSRERAVVVEVTPEPLSIQYWFTNPDDIDVHEDVFLNETVQHIIREVQMELTGGNEESAGNGRS